MKSIPIGNDIPFAWTIKRNGEAEDFSDKDVEVNLYDRFGHTCTLTCTITGNVITGTFRGKDQKNKGNYTLELIENKGADDMARTDVINAWKLVAHTADAGGTDESNIVTETITFTTELTSEESYIEKNNSGLQRKNLDSTDTTFTASATGKNATSFGGTASGDYAFSEGSRTHATGIQAHAEGDNTTAKGSSAHAEGSYTSAGDTAAHAEGISTEANGTAAHAEGSTTIANGEYSHAEGLGTSTNNQYEHAQGSYNKSTSGVTLHSIGIGTRTRVGQRWVTTLKNAEETTLDGLKYLLGVGGYDGTDTTAAEDIASVINEILSRLETLENA